MAGRPKVHIDWTLVGEMLEAGATAPGIAATVGVCRDILYKRCEADNGVNFSTFRQQKLAKGDDNLRVAQYKTAIEGSVPMQIWLGKNRLDQTDKQETTHKADNRDALLQQIRDEFIAAGKTPDEINAVFQKLYPDAQLVSDSVN